MQPSGCCSTCLVPGCGAGAWASRLPPFERTALGGTTAANERALSGASAPSDAFTDQDFAEKSYYNKLFTVHLTRRAHS